MHLRLVTAAVVQYDADDGCMFADVDGAVVECVEREELR